MMRNVYEVEIRRRGTKRSKEKQEMKRDMNDMKGTKQKNDEKNDSNLNKKEKKIESKLKKIQSQKEYISLMQKQSKKYFLKNAFSILLEREREIFFENNL